MSGLNAVGRDKACGERQAVLRLCADAESDNGQEHGGDGGAAEGVEVFEEEHSAFAPRYHSVLIEVEVAVAEATVEPRLPHQEWHLCMCDGFRSAVWGLGFR